MNQDQDAEVDRNFDYFQSIVTSLMAQHAGKFALLHGRKVIAYADTAAQAATEGYKLYPDGLFSIQRVTTTPVDLGFYSHVGDLRPSK